MAEFKFTFGVPASAVTFGAPTTTTAATADAGADGDEGAEGAEGGEVDVHFEPIVKLHAVEVKTGEEDEEELLNMKAKMFCWGEGNAGMQWKDRGSGDIRLLKHKATGVVRAVMRREKTLTLCANHVLAEEMVLETNFGSDRAFVYKVYADFSDGVCKAETMAIRFKDSELANQFKAAFNSARDANIALKAGGAAPTTTTTTTTSTETATAPATATTDTTTATTTSAETTSSSTTTATTEGKAEESKAEEKKAEAITDSDKAVNDVAASLAEVTVKETESS